MLKSCDEIMSGLEIDFDVKSAIERRAPAKEIAKAVRLAIREAGAHSVFSVRKSTGINGYIGIHVTAKADAVYGREELWAMKSSVKRFLVRNFPTLDNRSDSMQDYFDFVWIVY